MSVNLSKEEKDIIWHSLEESRKSNESLDEKKIEKLMKKFEGR